MWQSRGWRVESSAGFPVWMRRWAVWDLARTGGSVRRGLGLLRRVGFWGGWEMGGRGVREGGMGGSVGFVGESAFVWGCRSEVHAEGLWM